MKIEANDKEIRDVFSLGYFKIPRFQRPYSWKEEEVQNFWEDVVHENLDYYFIGSMVVYSIKRPFMGIVDGQQRLTTITLMLSALRNAFKVFQENDLAKGVHNFIEKADIDNVNIFILDSETSYPYLQSHIQSFDPDALDCLAGNEEQRLKDGFEIITNNLNKLLPKTHEGKLDLSQKDDAIRVLKNIRDKILSLKLVFIQLDNEEDAYLIFETLNTRGRDLTTADLVKNLLLKKLKSNQFKYDSPKEIWNEILERFDDHELDNGMRDFLYHYWLSKHSDVTEKKLFGTIKKMISSAETANDLLIDLKTNSKYYISIAAPHNYIWSNEEMKIKKSLLALKLFRVKQHTPMTLALVRAYKEKKISLRMLHNALKSMESFHFIFNAITQQRSSGSIASFYTNHAISLTKSTSHDEIQKVLDELRKSWLSKLPPYNEFEPGFLNLQFLNQKTRNKNLLKYILTRFMNQKSTGVSVDFDAMTIEHILPQSKSVSPEEDYIGSIGNLILIDSKTNSEELNDHCFLRKKEILSSKNYPLDDYISKSSTWEKDQINERTKLLSQDAFSKLWKI